MKIFRNNSRPGRGKRIIKRSAFALAVLCGLYILGYLKFVKPVEGMTYHPPGAPSKDNRTRAEEFLSHKRVAFVGAHPDDVEWSAAATARQFVERGSDVRFIVATRGDKGLPLMGWLREKSQGAAAKKMGVSYRFLDFKDKKLSGQIGPLAQDIKEALEEFRPDLVVYWDPEYFTNKHPDHIAIGKAGKQISGNWTTAYYGTWKPTVWIPYDERLRKIKLAALAAHRTEFPPLVWQRARAYQILSFEARGRQIGADNAETFRVVNKEE